MQTNPHEVLNRFWGFKEFREPQLAIIQSILNGNDTFSILPTGAGKSLCYQVPALCKENCSIVVTPLVALMQNQVDTLKKHSVPADYIHSGLKWFDIDRIVDNARTGQIKLLYVSPERFTQEKFLSRLTNIKIDFVTIDEAHCISQWGHDFRPAYLNIKNYRKQSNCPFLALTATATERVRIEIIELLELSKSHSTFITSSNRPKLSLSVCKDENKIDQLKNVLSKFSRSGIVYCRNRRISVDTATQLKQYGINIEAYHAGMDSSQRAKNLEQWMKNKISFISCTTAFGMGIDKPDVDIVAHIELPNSLEEYFQEAGRGGRGGQKSYGLTIYNDRDFIRLKKIYDNSFPGREHVQFIYKCLAHYLDLAVGSIMENSVDFNIIEFCLRYKLNKDTTLQTLRLLMQAGFIYIGTGLTNSSRVQIIANEEELQSLYKRTPKSKEVVVSMLRLFEGIFSLPVYIQEKLIAFQSKISLQEVSRILNQLHRENLILYFPHSELPQVQILNQRLHSKEIRLNEKWIAERKLLLKNQLDSIIEYILTDRCRQQYILEYFGERDIKECQICDNCLKKNKQFIPEATRKKWTEEIIELCRKKQNEVYIREIYQFYPSNKSHWVTKILNELVGEGILTRGIDKIKIVTTSN